MSSLVQAWCSVFELPGSLFGILTVGEVPLCSLSDFSLHAMPVPGLPAVPPRGVDEVQHFYQQFCAPEQLGRVTIEFLLVAPMGENFPGDPQHDDTSTYSPGGASTHSARQPSMGASSALRPEIWRFHGSLAKLFENQGQFGAAKTYQSLLANLRAKFLDVRPDFSSNNSNSSRSSHYPSSAMTISTASRKILMPAFPDAKLPPLQFGTGTFSSASSSSLLKSGSADDDDFNRVNHASVTPLSSWMPSLMSAPATTAGAVTVAAGVTMMSSLPNASAHQHNNHNNKTAGAKRSKSPVPENRPDHFLGAAAAANARAGARRPRTDAEGAASAAADQETLRLLQTTNSKLEVSFQPEKFDARSTQGGVEVKFMENAKNTHGRLRFACFFCHRCGADNVVMQRAMQTLMSNMAMLFGGAVTLRNNEQHVLDESRANARKVLEIEEASRKRCSKQFAQFLDLLNSKKRMLKGLKDQVAYLEMQLQEEMALREADAQNNNHNNNNSGGGSGLKREVKEEVRDMTDSGRAKFDTGSKTPDRAADFSDDDADGDNPKLAPNMGFGLDMLNGKYTHGSGGVGGGKDNTNDDDVEELELMQNPTDMMKPRQQLTKRQQMMVNNNKNNNKNNKDTKASANNGKPKGHQHQQPAAAAAAAFQLDPDNPAYNALSSTCMRGNTDYDEDKFGF